MIDQDLAHGPNRDRIEVRAILYLDLADDFQKNVVNKLGCIKGAPLILLAELSLCSPAEFVFDDTVELLPASFRPAAASLTSFVILPLSIGILALEENPPLGA